MAEGWIPAGIYRREGGGGGDDRIEGTQNRNKRMVNHDSQRLFNQ
jgi:hypothetical protein